MVGPLRVEVGGELDRFAVEVLWMGTGQELFVVEDRFLVVGSPFFGQLCHLLTAWASNPLLSLLTRVALPVELAANRRGGVEPLGRRLARF